MARNMSCRRLSLYWLLPINGFHSSTAKEINMKKFVLVGSLILLCSISGCGSGGDGILEDKIKYMNEYADALESNASADKLRDIQAKMAECDKKLKDLNLSNDETVKLNAKHQKELDKVNKRLSKAMESKMGGVSGHP
jgi:hypothetical protein